MALAGVREVAAMISCDEPADRAWQSAAWASPRRRR